MVQIENIDMILILLSYCIGSIPVGLIIGQLFFRKDIRKEGSGNLGGTNAVRVLGKKFGLLVGILDVGKGVLATSLPLLLHSHVPYVIIGAFAAIGHCYPLFAKFKGGKAVATTAGIVLVVNPIMFIAAFFVMLISLKSTRIVSISSVITSLFVVGYSIALGNQVVWYVMLFLCILIIYRHRMNFYRIIKGTEPKI